MNYDERDVLTQYIWNHYRWLMTDFERLVGTAIIGRVKADAAGAKKHAEMIRNKVGRSGDPDVEAALADGPKAFRRRVADRVMAERGDEVDLNRCPQCDRIPRTPLAKQCPWCFYRWHPDSAR